MPSDTVVLGTGPKPASVALVVEAPGEEEVTRGYPLAGPVGRVHWPLFTVGSGLNRHEVYVTHFKKQEMTEEEYKHGFEADDFEMWRALLMDELEEVAPDFVVTLGRHATGAFLGQDVDMEQVHGIPHRATRDGCCEGYGHDTVVFPAFAPSLRDARRLAFTMDDYLALGQLLAGKLKPWEPKPTKPRYKLWTADDAMLIGDRVSIDTEFEGDEPLMLTFTTAPGNGYAILAGDTERLQTFRAGLEHTRPTIVFHNALADLIMLKRMGIDIVTMGLPILDTMVLAWYRETEAQGLKNLAYRHLGVDRGGFQKIVEPYYRESLVAYAMGGMSLTEPPMLVRIGKKGKPLKPKPAPASRLHKLLKRFVSDHEKGRITDYLKRWDGWDEEPKAELEELLGPAPVLSLRNVPLEISVPYACADTDDTLALAAKLTPYNAELSRMDHAKIPMIAAMQERGLLFDMAKWEVLRDEVKGLLAAKEQELKEAAGVDFNPRSGDDIAEILYGFKSIAPGVGEFMKDKEYLVPPGWTKGKRPKTDKKALGQLRSEHVLPGILLEFKELEKLDNTYVSPMPRYLRGDGRFRILHPDFTHTRVPSGRLAARRPNIMAIPSRTSLGLRVRDLFVARPGHTFVAFDHSQIELRLAAEISKDEYMLSMFEQGMDLHMGTAVKILRKEAAQITKTQRTLFKTINFGILFGATAQRIYLELLSMGVRDYELTEVQAMVEEWFRLYAGITAEIAATERFIQQRGYVEDMWGRRRKLPGAYLHGRFWPQSMLREEAVRQGFNHRIQGGAQGLIIRAMIGFWGVDMPVMEAAGMAVFPLLQIHDELDFEVPDKPEAVELFTELGLDRMRADQPMFRVPIEASSSVASSWGGLK